MSKSKLLRNYILKLLSDDAPHSTNEMQHTIPQYETDYNTNLFLAAINTLLRQNKIQRVSRGVYQLVDGVSVENIAESPEEATHNTSNTEILNNSNDSNTVEMDTDNNQQSANRATICYIDSTDNNLYENILHSAFHTLKFDILKIDQSNIIYDITSDTFELLKNADIAIINLSLQNPNILYAIRYRAKLNRPIIVLKQKGENLPFDILNINTIEYDMHNPNEDFIFLLKNQIDKLKDKFRDNCYKNTDNIDNSSQTDMYIKYQLDMQLFETKCIAKKLTESNLDTDLKNISNLNLYLETILKNLQLNTRLVDILENFCNNTMQK